MSQEIEIVLKTKSEIDQQDIKNLEDVLLESDIVDNAEIMFKEIEQEQEIKRMQALQSQQDIIQNANEAIGITNSFIEMISRVHKNIETISKPFRIVLERVSNQLTFIDAIIEYKKTKDGLKVSLKIGATIIADRIFQVGVTASIGIAIIAFLALVIASIKIVGAIIVGIVVFAVGIGTFWWIAKQAENLINNVGGYIIDYIREFDIPLTEEEVRQMSVAHCHKTFETRNQQKFLRYGFNNSQQKQVFMNRINITHRLYPNHRILSNKAIIPTGFYSTWKNLTPEQLNELAQTLEQLKKGINND